MTDMPAGTAAPNRSGVPSSSSRASRSRITSRAARMTTGSAHAPPIQPYSSPAAVMIARDPCWPDEGPCRHTTVASANSSPARDSSPARSRTSHRSRELISVLHPDRRSAGHVVPFGDRLIHPVGQQRHVDVAYAGVLDRVQHRVDARGRAADGGALTDAL